MTRKKTASLVALVGALVVTACGGPPGGGEGDGSLTVGVALLPTTLDPGLAGFREDIAIMTLVGGTLTTLDQEGKQVGMTIAESVTPDGDNRFVVKLKPDQKFSDGTALTATDVVATFEHYLADKANWYALTFEPIKEVTAVDDLTVNFDLKQPYPSLPYVLSFPSSAILPSEAIEARGFKDLYKGDPLPTAGQFRIKSFGKDRLTLEANPNYAGQQPSTKTLIFEKIVDPAARLAQVQSGRIDYADGISPKQSAQISAPVEVRSSIGVNGVISLDSNNRDNSVMRDARIRQAVALAVDREQINQVAYAGLSQPTTSMWATSSQYHDPFLPEQPDIARAKELLAGTECEDGCELKFTVDSTKEQFVDTALIVEQNLQEIGIDVNVDMSETSTVYEQRSTGDFDLYTGIIYDLGDFPDWYLDYLLGPSFNAHQTGYSNPEVNRLINVVHTSDGAARDAAVDQINALYEKDQPTAPLVDNLIVSASRVPAETFDIGATFLYYVG